MPLILRVVCLNCWGLPLPWPIGSRDRTLRIKKIGEALLQDVYDIVALEEVWKESDFLRLQEVLHETYPFNYYFHSGFTGSGICVFSRHTIVSTLMHRFTLNGFAHHIHRGDWFGGKGVGLVEIEIDEYRINFYAAHLHAEYDPEKDLYLPHRLAQAFELSQFVKHTGYSADALILAGDFNIEPGGLAYHLIVRNANLSDAWLQKPVIFEVILTNSSDDSGATFERCDNCYTSRHLKNKKEEGKRLDFIMYRSGKSNVQLNRCEIRMNRVHDQKSINYSDHAGVYAEFFVSKQEDEIRNNLPSTSPTLLKEVIAVHQKGITRVSRDRFVFIGLIVVLVGLIVSTFLVEDHFPVVKTAGLILRFFLTLLVGFCLWHGFIGLTLEYKALKASKLSVAMLLND
uniref:sphingomyelin phosphodiesterase n=1 Tax=Setaria digitata TaxID=48799 RepID=A0A915Q3P1_9BILA